MHNGRNSHWGPIPTAGFGSRGWWNREAGPATLTNMKYDDFISRVASGVGVGRSDAEKLTRAVLSTLAERITGGEARDLADQLPIPLQTPLLPAREEAEAFDFVEFVRRVADRSGSDVNTAEMAVDVVFDVLRDAVTPGEFDDVLSQLPDDFKRVGSPPH